MSMNREFVMLAQSIDHQKHDIAHWYVSVKLDGQRAFWDGGITRGMPKRDVPWANNDKDNRYQEPPVATGLWSRYGNVIHPPEWFLNSLPKGLMLDGELYLGRGQFQECRKIISTLEPGAGWKDIRYRVFDLPSANTFFQHGKINNPNFHKLIVENDCDAFYKENSKEPALYRDVPDFTTAIKRMQVLAQRAQASQAASQPVWSFLNQYKLPGNNEEAYEKMYDLLNEETDKGGEGLMLRAPNSIWLPKRSASLLKVKKFDEGEAVVAGSITGQGKHLGRMGALIVQFISPKGESREFQLSGFTDEERELACPQGQAYAASNPGTILLGPYECKHFKRGQVVRFRHRTFTNEGIPREARYWR